MLLPGRILGREQAAPLAHRWAVSCCTQPDTFELGDRIFAAPVSTMWA